MTRNHQEVRRAFRRMVFNVLAHNRDDHVKNFAFLLDDTAGDWRLTPAYDLLYTPGPGGKHTMTVVGEGRNPGRSHMLRLAEQADVSKRDATVIIDETQAAVARWPNSRPDRRLASQHPPDRGRATWVVFVEHR